MHSACRNLSCSLVLLSLSAVLQAQSTQRVQAIRFWSFGDVTRVAIQTEGEYKLNYDQIPNPPRVYFDLTGLRPPTSLHRGVETILVNDGRIKTIRVAEVSPGKTRIVFDLETPVEVVSSQLVNPDRLMVELRPKAAVSSGITIMRSVTRAQRIDLSTEEKEKEEDRPQLPLAKTETAALIATPKGQPERIVTASNSITPPSPAPAAPKPEPAIQEPATSPPSSGHATATQITIPAGTQAALSGNGSLVRVFGLKIERVVIDAGHGGHDTGTIGPGGLMEKDLVLDVALRLGRLITRRMGAQVIYTRSTDVFIPLQERTKIANDAKADLFISIHANSSPERTATGVETYYFNLTSDKSGLDLAMRENASSTSSISDLNDLLHRAVLQTKLEESREFAQYVQTCLWAMSARMNSRSRDRGVRHAPFVVLIGATMPSILAEVGFISNPHDEKLMRRGDQRQKIAEALYKGISQYANSLNHVQVARAGT
jgi:N-acetylmuramoyl-L-alanine amidase